MKMEPPLFESRAEALDHFRRKYPRGTDYTTILEKDDCQPDGGGLSLSFSAPNHVASRHFVDSDGQPGSMAVHQRWCIWFAFDQDGKLESIEAELVSLPG